MMSFIERFNTLMFDLVVVASMNVMELSTPIGSQTAGQQGKYWPKVDLNSESEPQKRSYKTVA